MECEAVRLLQHGAMAWEDLIELEIVAVVSAKDTADATHPCSDLPGDVSAVDGVR